MKNYFTLIIFIIVLSLFGVYESFKLGKSIGILDAAHWVYIVTGADATSAINNAIASEMNVKIF